MFQSYGKKKNEYDTVTDHSGKSGRIRESSQALGGCKAHP